MLNIFKKGMIFNAVGVYSNFFIQFIITAILSHLLTPEDYGVVAIMQVFITFFYLMVESGMGPAVIQEKTLTQEETRILFNFSIIFAIIMAVLFGFFGIFLSKIYNNLVYLKLTWFQALSVLFNGVDVIPIALLNKEKSFKKINFSAVTASFISGIIGVTLAVLGFGIYALIISAIVSALINLVINTFFSKMLPICQWSLTPLKKIWSFSRNQWSSNLIVYFTTNLDNILVGKFMGASLLANYNKSYNLIKLPSQLFGGIFNPLIQPIFSDFQDNVSYIRENTFKIIHYMCLIGIPVSVFLSFSSKQIIYFFYGNQWSLAILPFSLLSLSAWVFLTNSAISGVMQARNHSGLLLTTNVINSLIVVGSIIFGVASGSIVNVAFYLTLANILDFFIASFFLVKISLQGKLRVYYFQLCSPLILGLILSVILTLFSYIQPINVVLSLGIRVIIFALVSLIFLTVTGEFQKIKRFFKH